MCFLFSKSVSFKNNIRKKTHILYDLPEIIESLNPLPLFSVTWTSSPFGLSLPPFLLCGCCLVKAPPSPPAGAVGRRDGLTRLLYMNVEGVYQLYSVILTGYCCPWQVTVSFP